MDLESMAKLRLDKRLAGRRGWIDAEELAQELEGLEDTASKIAAEDTESDPAPQGPGQPD